jgi:phage repressor protein C with HTH and peptisase S24 domain
MANGGESQLYCDLMRFKPDGLTANGWAVKAGVSRSVWSDMRRHGNPSRRTLAKLLAVAGSSLAEFEALQIGEEPRHRATDAPAGVTDTGASGWRPAPAIPLPVYASAIAGEYGRHIEMTGIDAGAVTEQVSRPDGLAGDRDAYAVTIVGDSMWPRFRPGRRVIVSPKAPVAIGDDVVVQLRGADDGSAARAVRALIKELVRRTAGFVELRQFNPDVSFRVEASEIAAIHKVMGEVV